MNIFKTTPKKSSVEVIHEIHTSFFDEVDRLLQEAGIKLPETTEKDELLSKVERLRSLGFSKTKEVQEAAKEELVLQNNKNENTRKEKLQKAIEYFSFKYPQYRFITEESVKRIAEQYGLVLGEAERYIGEVPTKNLEHIENFRIDDEDWCYVERDTLAPRGFWTEGSQVYSEGIVSFGIYNNHKDKPVDYSSIMITTYHKLPLSIVAPVSEFDMTGKRVEGYKIVDKVEDPIVLAPVQHGGAKYYLIVTAWGDEAYDREVLNPFHN